MKKFLKKILPKSIIEEGRFIQGLLEKIHEQYLIWTQPRLHQRALNQLQKKQGPINVIFFAIDYSTWKLDNVFQYMQEDSRFNPVILICPMVNHGREYMLSFLKESYDIFCAKGYNVKLSYDQETDTYVDVRSMEPDLIFYTNPYKGLIDNRYYISHFRDILTCYVSYHFGNSNQYRFFNDSLLQNLSWKLFIESTEHKLYYQQYTRRKGENTVVTGYPGIDKLIDPKYQYADVWKIKDRSVRRIIWAPHHSFYEDCPVHYSTFLRYSEFMLGLAVKYKESIQVAFKPHPLLKIKLDQYWGKERASEYYIAI